MKEVSLNKRESSKAKVNLNDSGDFIIISADNAALHERYVAGYKRIIELADEIDKKEDSIKQKYEGKEDMDSTTDFVVEIARARVEFSHNMTDVVDGIFGAGTVEKRFKDDFEDDKDFLPDAYSFLDFMYDVQPIIEEIFGEKMELQKKASKARMAKYQPQDHKKPQRKGAK